MKRIIKVNDELSIKIVEKKKKTVIFLYDCGTKTVLSDMKTGEFFFSKVAYDENYIVVYSRGCMVNQIPLDVEVAFDVKNKRFINLKNKRLKTVLEYMLISRKGFDLTKVLQTINPEYLGLVDEEEKDDLTRYLTAESDKISREQVREYILKEYPQLIKYTKLTGPISVIEYKKLIEEIGESTFFFHIMPLRLEFVPKPEISPNNPNREYYKQIYISETEHINKW